MRIHTLRILAAALSLSLATVALPALADEEDDDWGEYDASCVSKTVLPGAVRSVRRYFDDETATMVAINNASSDVLDMYVYNSTDDTACVSASADTSEETCSWTQEGGNERYRILVANTSTTDTVTYQVCVGVPQ